MERAANLSEGASAGRHSLRTGFTDRYAKHIMTAPVIVFMALMVVIPFVYTLYMSMHEWFASSQLPPRFIGLDNYARALFRDPRHIDSILLTFKFTGAAVGIELILGTGLAILFNRDFVGKGVIRSLFVLPMMATPIAIAMVFVMMYNPSIGVFNYLLSLIGLPPQSWLADRATVIPSLLVIDIWQWTPLVMLLVMAGLSSLPTEPFESARIDGAGAWQSFIYLTLPLLRPTLVVAALFRAIDALKTYDTIYATTAGGPGTASETLNIYVFQTGLFYFHMGYASALAVIFLAITLALAVIANAARRSV
jgi:multiple sugar transport system permease protein